MNASPRLKLVAFPFLIVCPGPVARADSPAGIFFSGPDANTTPATFAEAIPQTTDVTRPLPFSVFPLNQPGGVNLAGGDVNGDGRLELFVGSGAGGGRNVRVLDGISHAVLGSVQVSGVAFDAGVNLAAGDVTGDNRADILAASAGGRHVRIYNGTNFAPVTSIDAYPAGFSSGLRVGAADLNGDGRVEIITGTGTGVTARVKVYHGSDFSLMHEFLPYDAGFTGGIYVSGAKFDATTKADIVVAPGANNSSLPIKIFDGETLALNASYTPPAGSTGDGIITVGDFDGDGVQDVWVLQEGGKITIYSGKSDTVLDTIDTGSRGDPVSFAVGRFDGDARPDIAVGDAIFPLVQVLTPSFGQKIFGKFPWGPAYRGGIRVACGDVNGDGIFDMIHGPGTGGCDIVLCTGVDGGFLGAFSPFTPPTVFPVFVSAGDVNADGRDDIFASLGFGGGPQVKVFNATDFSPLHNFFAYSPAFTGGVTLAGGDFNNDGRDDIVTGNGPGMASMVKVFSGTNLAVLRSFSPEAAGFLGGIFVAAGDLTNDGIPDIVTGAGAAPPVVRAFDGVNSAPLGSFVAYDPAFAGGVRVAIGDVDGDSLPEILTSPGPGMAPEVRAFAFPGFSRAKTFRPFADQFTSGMFISSFTSAPAACTLTNFARSTGGNLALTGIAPRGRTLYFDSTENFADWQQLQSTPGTGTPFTFTRPLSAEPELFYRLRSQ